ncbi:MAG: hypothetical protein A3A13_03120 [Candidatus Yanofskybacteria bacterium RIFCSPLOWO2_01_FULL_43_22]|uniref:Uncharacterized protein n=1 Tax=Candidatus Yanofskybacteria bacterium RIFCSPLOWO2_01_FULL_43_22 TaxID=1802695 RepID=A0A1F8GJ77_9BACT|nr:MAG: hypothetical protein A3A13_03120 [Candidatus Yanofskybacteria bacterium RIFCSPLOWO2_01_FULL_43_22]
MTKKSYLAGGIFIIILITAGIYYFLFLKKDSPQITDGGVQNGDFDLNFDGNSQRPSVSRTNGTPDPNATSSAVREVPRLRKIANGPIAGAVAFDNKGKTAIRYIETVLGHIRETHADTVIDNRIASLNIPTVNRAFWERGGDGFIVQYIREGSEDIQTYKAVLVGTTSTTSANVSTDYTIKGSFMGQGIRDVSLLPSGKEFAYLAITENGSTISSGSFATASIKNIFSSPLREWQIDWPSKSNIVLTSAPRSSVGGASYILNTSNGSLTKKISGANGLTAKLNPSGTLFAYSESAQNSVSLHVLAVSSGTKNTLDIDTLIEKCAWSAIASEILYCAVPQIIPPAFYPDAWYEGVVSFNDEIWQINTKTRELHLLVRLDSEAGAPIDSVKLFLDPKENYIFFTNKKDDSLWSYKIRE